MGPRKKRGGRAAALAEKALEAEEVGKEGLGEGERADPQLVEALMKDLQTQTETRCQQILDEAASLKLELKGRFKIEMLKLPKMIREMPLVQFQEEYGEDLLTVSKEAAEEAIKSRGRELEEPKTAVKGSGRGGRTNNSSQQQDMPPPVPANGNPTIPALMTVHAVDAGAMPMQTPMRGNRGPMVPMTPSTVRLARQGEMLVSANGSPILQQASIAAVTEKEGAQIAVELPDIGLVNVETDMDNLTEGMKKQAFGKLQNLQDQISELMNQLDN